MKKILLMIPAAALALLSLVACNEALTPDVNEMSGQEICFGVKSPDIDIDVETKAVTPVTSAPSSLYWEAKSGSTVKYAVSSVSYASNKYNTGKYWPSTSASYSYMVSNVAFTTSTGNIAAAENTMDIVVGTATDVSDNTCSITLQHIFARTGSVTINTRSGYTLSNASWTIVGKGSKAGTKGSYTIGTGWVSRTTALSSQALTSSSDLYLIPDVYTVGVTFTLTKGDFVKTYTASSDVTLTGGKINNIVCNVGDITGTDEATNITFDVTVTPWTEVTASTSWNL